MNAYLDIETIPTQSPNAREEIAATIKPPGNYSKAETIAAWERDTKPALVEEAWRKSAMDGTSGHLICAAFAIDDGVIGVARAQPEADAFATPMDATRYAAWLETERQTLISLYAALTLLYGAAGSKHDRCTFIGHKIADFDLRFLFKRSVILGVRPPSFIPFNRRPWDERLFDTMTQWAGFGNFISLDRLCAALGLPGKGSELGEHIDGSLVWDFAKAGKFEEISVYCMADVERVRQAHRRMTFA